MKRKSLKGKLTNQSLQSKNVFQYITKAWAEHRNIAPIEVSLDAVNVDKPNWFRKDPRSTKDLTSKRNTSLDWERELKIEREHETF